MRKIFGSLASLVAAAGLALGQPAAPVEPLTAPATSGPVDVTEPPSVAVGNNSVTPRVWIGAEYLLWWTKDGPSTPPILTSGGLGGPNPGVPGNPGTMILLGTKDYDYGTASGLRLNAGGWLNADRTLGLESSAFLLERKAFGASFANDGSATAPFFFVPINVVVPPVGPTGIPIAGPGGAGNVALTTTSRLWGSDINLAANVVRTGRFSATLLGGFRYLELDESLNFDSNLFILPLPGPMVTFHDSFGTQNRFYGGQIGGKFEWVRGRFFLNNTTKLALGSTHETISINGSTAVLIPPGLSAGFPGGNLTATSNIGRTKSDQVTVVPEIGVNVGVQLTPGIRTYIGYTFLYWSNVARPGDQVDTRFDFVNVPPTAPVAPGNHTDFWAHGLNFGLEFRY